MDYYLNNRNVIARLVKEWKEHGDLIISYDYDNTVFDYGNHGHTYNDVIRLLKRCKKIGAKFIVFTCCGEEKYPDIIKYLNENNIPFDKINENVDGISFGGSKVYSNLLLDDRAGLQSAFDALSTACSIMEIKQ